MFLTSVILSVTLLLALLAGLVYLFVQYRLQRRHLCDLQQQLQVFVDTSINVARCVDQMAIHNGAGQRTQTDGPVANQAGASRRWLLAEAKHRLQAGTPLEEAGMSLGLHRDELRMLSLVQSG